MLTPRRLPPPVLLPLLLVLATGCGVSFSDGFDGTELFKDIDLAGERSVGSELTLTVSVAPVYAVPVRIACFYEDADELTDDEVRLAFEERATKIGEAVLPPAADRRPDEGDAVPTEELRFRFAVHEPGHYFLACLTPAAADNGYGLRFEIA